MYVYIYNIYRERESEREWEREEKRESNHGKKITCLKNIDESLLYQFIVFTFLLKLLLKIFFTIFTVDFKHKVKILW